MLDLATRTAILRLAKEGHSVRAIAKSVGVSRASAHDVLQSGAAEVPKLERAEKSEPHLERIRELHATCKGNLVRVQEELALEGIDLAYSTLTAFCRRHDLGQRHKQRAGEYIFAPGEEMQHDTSPHTVTVGDRQRLMQCASLVLCFSRMVYMQVYPHWSRFECRIFLSKALRYFGGAAGRTMIDNSSVVIAHGTGKNAVPAPEMRALGERFDFVFEAHELGDKNRSAHVERRFDHIEKNFYPGRTFESLVDLNVQAEAWCEQKNHTWRRSLHASPVELFASERGALRPLPLYLPEVYESHFRRVDVMGFVTLHTNRYSVPDELLGRQVRVLEYEDRIAIFDGHRLVTEHERLEPGADLRLVLPAHHLPRPARGAPAPRQPEEITLRTASPLLARLVDELQHRHGGRALRAVRRLHKLFLDYPSDALLPAVSRALDHGLLDLDRIERLVLRNTGGVFFRLPGADDPDLF
jgi:transposase